PCFGDLELQNLSFSYEKDKAVLSDINIAFPKGSKTVLIGRNGSGKSTLISLLLQLYQPTGGKITLNGIDISEFVLREYRNMISVVSQEIYLFNSSIRDNICMYKNIDDKTIMEACKDSGLADFISEVSLDYV
ncbi:ATP-binding cassette domain-containing protein, partial [[Eubacterium] rectale]